MPVPAAFTGRFRVPVIAAPMFLVSGPELVIACCQAGVAGTFPSLNARPASELEVWLSRVEEALAAFRREHPSGPVRPMASISLCTTPIPVCRRIWPVSWPIACPSSSPAWAIRRPS